jgi:hypothetical protein
MILTEENGITTIKHCPSAILPTKNPTWVDPGANPGLFNMRAAPEPWYGQLCSLMNDVKLTFKLKSGRSSLNTWVRACESEKNNQTPYWKIPQAKSM